MLGWSLCLQPKNERARPWNEVKKCRKGLGSLFVDHSSHPLESGRLHAVRDTWWSSLLTDLVSQARLFPFCISCFQYSVLCVDTESIQYCVPILKVFSIVCRY